MKGFIQSTLFRKHFEKLKKQSKNRYKGGVNELMSVSIIAQSPYHSASELDAAHRHFVKRGVKCHSYLVTTDKDLSSVSDVLNYIKKDDIAWYGVPNQEMLIKWLSHKTDLLIILNPNHTPLLRYLCAASNSRLKSSINYGFDKDNDIDFYLEMADISSKNARQLCTSIYEELAKVAAITVT